MVINHQLDIAVQIPSENFNQRPPNSEITLIVIHNISLPPSEFNNDYIEDFLPIILILASTLILKQ